MTQQAVAPLATPSNEAPYSLSDFAQEVRTAAAWAERGDGERFKAAIREPISKLVARDDLLQIGMPRQGNNVAESYYLYFDGDLSVVLFKVPQDPPVQPHDHGIWETLFVYRGIIQHVVYERTDDGRKEGFALLRQHASARLTVGDFAVVAPPQDIHGFHAVQEDTYGITVSRGQYALERRYYDVEAQTYAIRQPRTLR